jgi:hypothetical protein
MKFQSSTHRQLCSALVRLSVLMRGRLRPRTRSCPSSATYSYTTSETFLFWTRRRRRSSGKINSKLYVRRSYALVWELADSRHRQFLESFASKDISSSEDRLEETKRRKLALKAHKLVELMMVSGVPTASGYEERIRFAEMEIVDRQANEKGLTMNAPSGHFINGWDVNIAGVRTTSVKKHLRYHTHAVRHRSQLDCNRTNSPL